MSFLYCHDANAMCGPDKHKCHAGPIERGAQTLCVLPFRICADNL